MRHLEGRRELLGAQSCRHGKGAKVIGAAIRKRGPRRDEVGQREIRLAVGDRFLLSKHVEPRSARATVPRRGKRRYRRLRWPPARTRRRHSP